MIRFRLYFDKDPETEWLNQMVSDGWALKGFFAGFYSFEKCGKGEWIYQIDFGDHAYHVSDEYRELMTDLGIEIVALWGFWIILRKRAADGPFELYTDTESMIGHYRKILKMFMGVIALELICFLVEVIGGVTGTGIAWGFAVLIAVLTAACGRAAFKMQKVISRLEAEKNGIEQ